MIVSHEHRFIFIRTRKTAGTSLEIALSRLVGDDAVVTSLSPRDERIRRAHGGRPPQNHLLRAAPPDAEVVPPGPGPGIVFYNHMPARAVRALLGEKVWRTYFTFCFERNPWDKVVSLYYHRYRTPPRPGIDHFVRSGEARDAYNWPLYTLNDAVAVDMVGRYETLLADVKHVAAELGLPELTPLPEAKTQFRPFGADHRHVLDDPLRAVIAREYAREIQYHGYEW
ncbi:sulfotransferase family 2 domain-containing protein [Actinomadura rayongensis]|uniref:Sulfotransferase family protein n=1 Tax=Actinomadura rayongensis TaxID=1429076 RepID=A0A6I4WI22_9ACTN|nr:hypothetical protein [Actinomadura rayongensis]